MELNLGFNQNIPTVMHIDLNSCFASIEQQANPLLRGKPIAVAAYTTDSGCILAPSVEAKLLGVKTGMRVKEGRLLCPSLVVLAPDPDKYRQIHLKLKKLLSNYTDDLVPKSIDEFVLNLEGYPAFKLGMEEVAREIKKRIKREIGDWLRVSIGIGTNRFLAKTGAGLHKPDGLDLIDKSNYKEIYKKLTLTDLCGIDKQNAARLNNAGIFSVLQMSEASISQLRTAFQSIAGYYWYVRLRGFEIDDVDFARRSYGNSYALPQPFVDERDLMPIVSKLVQKTGYRMRRGGYAARGVHLAILYRDNTFWHQGRTLDEEIFDSRDIYRNIYRTFKHCPYKKPVANLAISCYNLNKRQVDQLALFDDVLKKKKLVEAVDKINERWGQFVITPALMMGMNEKVIDRISFGGVKDILD